MSGVLNELKNLFKNLNSAAFVIMLFTEEILAAICNKEYRAFV